jgi:hypothetical protein
MDWKLLPDMVDNRQPIERRPHMIKMAWFFKSRRRLALAAGLFCLVVSGGVLLTNGLTRQAPSANTISYNAATLLQYKTAYVGDNSRVVNLISNLPYADLRREVSLQTESIPYGVTVDYDFSGADLDARQIESVFRDNAVILFALIDNADVITFHAKGSLQPSPYRYLRDALQKGFAHDLREYAKDVTALETLLRSLAFRLHVHPEKYALFMSSTPGIRITPEYRGAAAKARYSAENGALFTWDFSTGEMSKGLPVIELPVGTTVYWSPLAPGGQLSVSNKNPVTVTLLDEKDQRIDEKQVTIVYDGSLFYTVEPSPGIVIGEETLSANPTTGDLDEAVGLAIQSRRTAYGAGETATEGHLVLDSEESNGTVKVYTIASFGAFGFENGIFTKVSGSGAIPTVMIFSRDENGAYSLLEYKEPQDGAGYIDSIKKMFPQKLRDRVLSSQGDYPDLVRQQEVQAAEYLKSIGRTAEVSAAHVDKKLPDINVDASNKLFAEYTKYDLFLNNCPYWIGDREKAGDGYALIVFRKTGEDGAIVEERRYKIVGGEPQLMETSLR